MESTKTARTPSHIRTLFKMEKYFTSEICKELLRSRIRHLIMDSIDILDIELYEELLVEIDLKADFIEETRKIVRYDETNGMVYNGRKKDKIRDTNVVLPEPALGLFPPEEVKVYVEVKPKVEVIKVFVKEKINVDKVIQSRMIVAALRLYKGSEKDAAAYCGISINELKYWMRFYKIIQIKKTI